jgi:tRNA nucleotidyltransferase (CCA-adding enzyme)
LIPELQSCFISNDQAQVEWRSLANTIASSPPSRAIRWVLLLDLITRRRDAGAARQILQRFCYGQKEVQYILQLLKHKEKKLLPEPPCVKRALRLLGMQGLLDLIAVQEALATPKGCRRALGILRRVKSLVREIVGSGACYSLDMLAVNGKDLIKLGIPEGPKVGGLLEKIMMQVIDDQLENNRESLLHYAKGVLHEFS